jgi:hypothetical protein
MGAAQVVRETTQDSSADGVSECPGSGINERTRVKGGSPGAGMQGHGHRDA